MAWVRLGSLLMFLGVLLGAFGAHGLKHTLTEEGRTVWSTAVMYHLVHGVGLLAVGWLATLRPAEARLPQAGWLFILGITLFSGSLYLLALTGIKKLGIITPFGGLAFLAGWLLLALSAR
jgi:uncharacterized membrane protein YgdD (TMEM256/DUF423 family)